MLLPRLTNCKQCADILSDIDCKIGKIAKDLYNNTIFAVNTPINEDVMWDLLNYKRILTYKLCNSQYVSLYTLNKIAGKVNLLKFK